MAAPNALNQRIEILQMAEAQGKALRPEHKAELDNYRAQGLAKGSTVGGKATEGERTAAFLATRLGGALKTLRSTTEATPSAAAPGLVQEAVRGTLGDTAANFATSESRQRVEAAQLEALDAALTLGTGAAYTREQLEGYRKAYFPMLGDDPATVADKAARLDTVIKAARIKAGAAASSIDDALGDMPPPANDKPPVLNTAEAAGAVATNAIDKAAGIEPPPAPVTPDGALRVNIPNPNAKREPPLGRGDPGFVQSMDAAIRGAADTATLGFADEISAAGKTIFDGGTMADNLRNERAIDRYDSQNNFGARTAGQLVGGLALPMGAARGAAALGRAGVAYGAGYGFGSGETTGKRIGGAVTGAALGGATGAGLGALGAYAGRARGAGGGNVEGRATLEAGNRLGIEPLPADVGGSFVRGATATAAQLPGAASSVRAGAQRVNTQALGARDRIAANVGVAVEPEAAGEAAKAGAQAFIERTSGVGRGAYDRAERLAGNAMVDPVNARRALTVNINELSQVPGGADGLAALETLRDELGGQFTVQGIRGMRTALRDRFISDGLRGSDLERRVNQVIDAANEDVVASLNAAGNAPAARAYAVADRYWRNRLRVIDETLAPIIGKDGEKSGEQVIQALNTAAKGNSARLDRFVRSLPADESATVRATVISQLGRASAGTQDATGTAFSLPQFLTHWNQMQPGAKRALFDGQTRAALDDLATVASGTKQAQRFANTSNTGGVVGGIATASTAARDLATLGKTLAVQYGAGRLLSSPGFARWLARAPNANPRNHVQALGVLASRNPAIAQELTGLQARLTEAITRAPSRAAASEEPDK